MMNKREINTKDLMELDKVINAFSIVERLQGELVKLERQCEEYQKQMSALQPKTQSKEKKSYKHLGITGLVFVGIIALLFLMYWIFGLLFLENLKIPGVLLVLLGFGIGVAGVIVKVKEIKVKKEETAPIKDSRWLKLQEKLESTEGDINKIKETILKVEKMASDLIEKYDELVGNGTYVEKLLQIKQDMEEQLQLKKTQE